MSITDYVIEGFMDLIFQPGSSLKLVPVINLSVVLLLGLLVFLTYNELAIIHLVVMSLLSLGLLTSVNWLNYEFQKQKQLQENNDSNNNNNIKDDNSKKSKPKKSYAAAVKCD